MSAVIRAQGSPWVLSEPFANSWPRRSLTDRESFSEKQYGPPTPINPITGDQKRERRVIAAAYVLDLAGVFVFRRQSVSEREKAVSIFGNALSDKIKQLRRSRIPTAAVHPDDHFFACDVFFYVEHFSV